MVCNYDDKNLTTGLCAHGSSLHSRVDVHVRCVEGALGLDGHYVIGVVLGFTLQTQFQV